MSPDDIIKASGAIVVAVASLTLAYQRYSVLRAKDRTTTAGESTTAAQFETLQAAIEHNRVETSALRVDVTRMNGVIHTQQQTITRMEMLLRLFAGLVQQHGIDVPRYMSAELSALIVDSDIDRPPKL